MKKFFQEFKEFALTSNVMALAVGVLIGGGLQRVVSSLVDNLLTPIIEKFTGSDLSQLTFSPLGINLQYGAFVANVIDFILIALIVFMIVKAVNKVASIKKTKEPPKPRKCPFCITQLQEKATRCPACTSEVPPEPHLDIDTKQIVK